MKDYTYEWTHTEASKDGTLICNDNKLKYKIRNDLKFYKEKQIESTFLEIIKPNLKSKVVGCIYKHPNVLITELTKNYIDPLPEKLSCEKKEIILMGDFNMNLLNYDSNKDTTDLLGNMYASSFNPTINTSTRITAISKTLVDNIFYNDFTKKSCSRKHN